MATVDYLRLLSCYMNLNCKQLTSDADRILHCEKEEQYRTLLNNFCRICINKTDEQ